MNTQKMDILINTRGYTFLLKYPRSKELKTKLIYDYDKKQKEKDWGKRSYPILLNLIEYHLTRISVSIMKRLLHPQQHIASFKEYKT